MLGHVGDNGGWDIPEDQMVTGRIGRRTIDRSTTPKTVSPLAKHKQLSSIPMKVKRHSNSNSNSMSTVHPSTPTLVGHSVGPGYQEPNIRMHDYMPCICIRWTTTRKSTRKSGGARPKDLDWPLVLAVRYDDPHLALGYFRLNRNVQDNCRSTSYPPLALD